MNTYEVAQAIRKLESDIQTLRATLHLIKKANPKKDSNLALRKMQRLRNFSITATKQVDKAEELMKAANPPQRLWVGDSVMDLIELMEETKALILAEQKIAEGSETE